jgi:hypothetical protein
MIDFIVRRAAAAATSLVWGFLHSFVGKVEFLAAVLCDETLLQLRI